MKLAGRLVNTEEGLAHLKKSFVRNKSFAITLPKEWLYSIGKCDEDNPPEFLVFFKDDALVIKSYTGQGEVVLDTRGTSDRD